MLHYLSYWKVSRTSVWNLFHGKSSPLYLVLFPVMHRTTYYLSLHHDGPLRISGFLLWCFHHKSIPEQPQFALPFLWGHVSKIIPAGLSSGLSLVFVYFIRWLNTKCGDVKSCFWRLWMVQAVGRSTWARISPQLSGPFCPLWNACGEKLVHKLCLQQRQMRGKGTYVNVLWQLNKTDSERMLYRENTYGNVLRKNKHI